MSMEMNKALDLLRGLVSEVERKTCEHEETHRGGAIWEICDSCGAKWADDEGGKPEFAWPESVEKARAFLATHPAVEQAGGDERVIGWRERILAAHPNSDPGFWPDALLVEHMAAEIADLRAALAQPSPAQAEQHWPKLEKPAQVGAIRFSAGVSSRLVVEAAQRLYEFESTPEQEAERIERLQAFREQCFEPLGAEFSKVLSENLVELSSEAKPEQAEAERPEVVARVVHSNPIVLGQCGPLNANDELMTVAQHAASVARWAEMFNRVEQERDAAMARVAELKTMADNYCALLMDANAKLAELEKEEPINLQHMAVAADGELRWMTGRKIDNCELYAAPVAQAQQLHDLDKQCRDDVARALGLRPNQERGFAWSYLLASIKSCVKASGDSAQAQHSVPDGWVQSLPLKDHQPCKSNEDRANGYVIPIYSRPVPVEEALRKLRAVLCDPVGNVVIDGSDGDREEVQRALGMLAAAPGNSAQHSVPGKYDDVLLPFLKSMEHELHANAGKGDRPGWLQMDRRTALLEIYYHLAKLQKATKDNDAAGIVEYAADVANMSMMLVDVCGLLAAAPA